MSCKNYTPPLIACQSEDTWAYKPKDSEWIVTYIDSNDIICERYIQGQRQTLNAPIKDIQIGNIKRGDEIKIKF